MSTVAVGRSQTFVEPRVMILGAPRALAVWIIPLLYPLSLAAIAYSAALLRAGARDAVPLLTASIAWAIAGPFVGWLTLNYLDKNRLDRSQCRLVVHGAVLAAVTPPLYTALRQISSATLPAWYIASALAAAAALLPVPAPLSTPKFLRVHGYSAMLIALFALAHVTNHSLAIISLQTHSAVLHVLRVVYRERVIETLLVVAVLGQVCTGSTMAWKSYLRPANPIRNMQLLSGLFLAIFFLSHLFAVYHTRQKGIDTDFVWAIGGPEGLLGVHGSIGQVPRYPLSVLIVFVHLATQLRLRLPRVMSDKAARRIFYGVLATGGVAMVVVGAAACGVHLIP